MKQVYVIRHSYPDYVNDAITNEGKEYCRKVKSTFPHFDLVFSSPSGRTKQTAYELTGVNPIEDERAFFPILNPDKHVKVVREGKTNPNGSVGALFEMKETLPLVKKKGEECVSLIQDIFHKLPADGMALLVSHSWTMASVKKILLKESFDSAPKDFPYVGGYIINEDLSVGAF